MSMPHLLTITVIFNRLKVYQLLTCVQKVFLQHPMTTRYSALLIKSSSKHFQVKKSCTSSKEAKNITCKCACLNFIMFSTKDRGSGPNCCFWVCTQNFSTVLSLYFKTCQSDWKNTTKTITNRKWEYSNLSGKSYLDQTPNSCTSLRGNVWQLQERIDYQILEVKRVNSIFLSENKYVLAFWYYMILNINRDRRLIVEESKLDEKLSRKKIIVSHDSKEIVSNYPPKWMWNFTQPQNKVIIHNFRQHWGE